MGVIVYHPESDCTFVANPDQMGDLDWGHVYEVAPHEIPDGTQIRSLGAYPSTVRPSLDFETYSEAGFTVDRVTKTVRGIGANGKGGLPVVGTPVYAEHPSTEILCLYYDLKDGRGVRGFIPGLSAEPTDLLEHVKNGGWLEAFNYTFEWWIWNMVCVRRYGWPPISFDRGVCVMARARRFSMPGSLATCSKVLGLEGKQKDGKQLIQQLTRPHKPTKTRPEFRRLPRTHFEEFKRLYSYCAQDVTAEDMVAAHLPDMSDYERATWITDQRINARGVLVDRVTLDRCLYLYNETEKRLTVELGQITGGAVGSVGETAKMCEWLNGQGLPIADVKAETIEGRLQKIDNAVKIMSGELVNVHPVDYDDAPKFAQFRGGKVERVLQIRQALAGANIKKLFSLDRSLSSDNRLRDQYMYCGADQTGRWSAGGVQLQNLTAKGPKTRRCDDCGRYFGDGIKTLEHPNACPECGSDNTPLVDWLIDPMVAAIEDINRYYDKPDLFAGLWVDAVETITGCLRGLFKASEGKRLICCDFSAIEAVVLACLSGCQWRIDVFATHGKIYEMSAAAITGNSLEYYLDYKKQNGTHHPDRKKVGKVAELASGYGGWIGAWKAFGATQSDDELKQLIIKWREASPEIVEFWGGQFRQIGPKPWDAVPELFGLEGAFIAAVRNPGKYYDVGPITMAYDNRADVLYLRLPSGRFLHYHRPKLIPDEDKLKRGPCVKITFEGYNTNSQKGPIGWIVKDTYGGRLAENVTQAVAADIQAEALVRVERAGYPVVMHTHDEIIAEVEHGRGSWQEMAAIMSERPAWASWWPIKADGWEHERYQKD